jgi:hypothetical protein
MEFLVDNSTDDTDGLPEPLTPADADVRSCPYMPLYGDRLFRSDFSFKASDAEFRAAMQLWWEAWRQVPAGSLPDNEKALACLSGAAGDLRKWRRIAGVALHGFVKCADGRLYHPIICDAAMGVLKSRSGERTKKANQREKLKNKGASTRGKTQHTGNDVHVDTCHYTETVSTGTSTYVSPPLTKLNLTKQEKHLHLHRGEPPACTRARGIVADADESFLKDKESSGSSEPQASREADPELDSPQSASQPDASQAAPQVGGWEKNFRKLPPGVVGPRPLAKHEMPRLSELPDGWRRLGLPVEHRRWAGEMRDVPCYREAVFPDFAQEVCTVARMMQDHRQDDWYLIISWLADGISQSTIIAAIEAWVEKSGDKYRPPSWIQALDRPVRAFHAQQQGLAA